MAWICGQEGIQADEEALSVLAQAGEGSVRDSLSALDQAIACCGNKLDAAEVRALLGAFSLDGGAGHRRRWRRSDRRRDARRGGRTGAQRAEPAAFSAASCRAISATCWWRKSRAADTRLIAASPRASAQRLARDRRAVFSEEDLTRYLQLSLDLFRDLQFSLQPRFHLEIGLLKMVQAGQAGVDRRSAGAVSAEAAAEPRDRPLRQASATAAPAPRAGPSPFELDRVKKAATPPAPEPATPSAFPAR